MLLSRNRGGVDVTRRSLGRELLKARHIRRDLSRLTQRRDRSIIRSSDEKSGDYFLFLYMVHLLPVWS